MKPDYIVKALPQDGGPDWKRSTRIGAAWINESGAISMDLDPFVVLSGKDNPKILLVPNKDKPG